MEEVEGLLGRAELYFGRKVTAAGVAIVGLGAVVAALNAIWSNALAPISKTLSKQGVSFDTLTYVAYWTAILLLTYFAVYEGRAHRRYRSDVAKLHETVDRGEAAMNAAREAHNEAMETHRQAKEYHRETQDNLSASILLLEAVADYLERTDASGREKAASIRSLLDTVSRVQL